MFYWVLDHRQGWTHSEIFRSLLGNSEFRRTFINRLADLMNTAFAPPHFQALADELVETLAPEVGRHFGRWYRPVSDFHRHAMELVPAFGHERAHHVHGHVLQRFGFTGTYRLAMEAYPPSAGRITLNSITPELPFEGIYFSGNPIDLEAHAAEGFMFDHWEWSGEQPDRWDTRNVQKDLGGPGRLTAYFRRTDEQLSVFPNPFMDELHMAVNVDDDGAATLRLMDIQGRTLVERIVSVHQGTNRLSLAVAGQAPGVYLLQLEGPGFRRTARVVRAN